MNSYIFVNGVEIYEFKAKDSEINATPLFSDNVSNNFSVDNTRKTKSYVYVYNFSVDYDGIDVDDILGIHKYITKRYVIK